MQETSTEFINKLKSENGINEGCKQRIERNKQLESSMNSEIQYEITLLNEFAYSYRSVISKNIVLTNIINDTIIVTTVYPAHLTENGIIAIFNVNGKDLCRSYYGTLCN